ncbi:hypothetical protein DFJ58DRAFT_730839 [Suillus subalutaceus]|uniref:uncharacterized protein n=1 Tax=Suillus subalutaceus TaxID=48586 RepID=UPI001B865E69|nr:uncharacterized protein DFJ58DRAFT_730839 [Suillus subalutaceus]KAG1845495.1 hypothetical protein DFJ58DRAFT_730839 [Suillus subalutaceus]
MGPQNNLYCNPVSARKVEAAQAEVRRKASGFQRQMEARARAQADVVETLETLEAEAVVDVMGQWTKKWVSATLKRWLGRMLKRRRDVVKEEGGSTAGEGCAQEDI